MTICKIGIRTNRDATINGLNAITIRATDGLTGTMQGGIFTISAAQIVQMIQEMSGGSVEELTAKLNQEIVDRIAGDNALGSRIDVETQARQQADSLLNTAITTETNRATQAEEALGSRIDSEAETRDQEISRVEGLISTEAETRAQEDSRVEGLVSAEELRATGAEGALGDRINQIDTTMSGYGDIVTHNASEFATAAQGSKADSALQSSDVINNLTSSVTNKPLSAAMGKALDERLKNVESLGRYLSQWNCVTGLALTNPLESPYEYRSGDYFFVQTVAAEGGTNYCPSGTSYVIGQASTVVETQPVFPGDMYFYDGTQWILRGIIQRTILFSSLVGSPYDNDALAAALNEKQPTLTAGTDIEIDSNNVIKFTNNSGYIKGITGSMVTTALGYTPYNSTNPNNYISRSGISATSPISYNSTTGVISIASGYRVTTTAQVTQIGTLATTIGGYGDIVTHNVSEFATAAQGALAESALQSIDSDDVTNALGYTPMNSTTKYAADLSYSSSILQLKDQTGANIGSPVTITAGAGSLSSLTDVTITTPVTGQSLVWNGIKWVNGSGLPDPMGSNGTVLAIDNGVYVIKSPVIFRKWS